MVWWINEGTICSTSKRYNYLNCSHTESSKKNGQGNPQKSSLARHHDNRYYCSSLHSIHRVCITMYFVLIIIALIQCCCLFQSGLLKNHLQREDRRKVAPQPQRKRRRVIGRENYLNYPIYAVWWVSEWLSDFSTFNAGVLRGACYSKYIKIHRWKLLFQFFKDFLIFWLL